MFTQRLLATRPTIARILSRKSQRLGTPFSQPHNTAAVVKRLVASYVTGPAKQIELAFAQFGKASVLNRLAAYAQEGFRRILETRLGELARPLGHFNAIRIQMPPVRIHPPTFPTAERIQLKNMRMPLVRQLLFQHANAVLHLMPEVPVSHTRRGPVRRVKAVVPPFLALEDNSFKRPARATAPRLPRASASYQVREAMARNCATVDTWEFKPPSTVTTWPVK